MKTQLLKGLQNDLVTEPKSREQLAKLQPLDMAIEFMGTESNTIVIHEGPRSRICPILNTNNEHLQNTKMEKDHIYAIQGYRNQLFRQHLENIVISILNSCVNLKYTVKFDDLHVYQIGLVNKTDRIAPTDEDYIVSQNKYSIDNLRQYLYEEPTRLTIMDVYYNNISVFENEHDGYVLEFVNAITMNFYNILSSLIVTELDLLCTKAIIELFHHKLATAFIKFKHEEFPSYKFNYIGEKIRASKGNDYGDYY